ncbi:MEKHLA domain-containing protein [Tropicibacter sp. R16_0]|uniref:MEKHLA domain-containing protein n=1 Tax=Tropicibacter sp. R16_0 TaxID=2821102 RepID=UPI001ADB43E7|nr:MEKHLA domain-containing protein [Tropicibacter sp. R16_0]MBO9453214.1 MEKHLA domain-containing protein [Tropicibacter sp. R16_0]
MSEKQLTEPAPGNGFQADHATLLMASFARVTGRPLLDGANPRALYHAPFPILSHNTAEDPVLTYGNLAAQQLWEMGWDQLTALPSRLTAEPAERGQRDAMFAEMRAKGFIENYAGIRVSATGKRFEIRNAIIWPLLTEDGTKLGEAATFKDYTFL